MGVGTSGCRFPLRLLEQLWGENGGKRDSVDTADSASTSGVVDIWRTVNTPYTADSRDTLETVRGADAQDTRNTVDIFSQSRRLRDCAHFVVTLDTL